MADLFFFIRMMIITSALIILMQIKIGSVTIEEHAMNWARTSVIVDSLREVSNGGVKLLSQGYKTVVQAVDKSLGGKFNREQMAGSRSLVRFERSQGYRREQEQKQKAQSEEHDDVSAALPEGEQSSVQSSLAE